MSKRKQHRPEFKTKVALGSRLIDSEPEQDGRGERDC